LTGEIICSVLRDLTDCGQTSVGTGAHGYWHRCDVEIADDTFIVAAPADVAAVVADEARWRQWWPDLALTVVRDRGVAGVVWAVRGPLDGEMEIWLEAVADGVVLHYLVRAQAADRHPDRLREQRTRAWKRHAHQLKDELEAGREPGRPRGAAVKEPGPAAE
jgi:hypothetical protein